MNSEGCLKRFWNRATRLATGVTLAAALGMFALAPNGRALALGLLLGGVVSQVRFRIRYSAVQHADSARPMLRTAFANYGLNAAALGVAFLLSSTFSPWATVAGLLTMNAAVVAAELLSPESRSDGPEPGTESPTIEG